MNPTLGLTAIQVRVGHPDFLDLPWSQPLSAWPDHCARLVQVQRGLSRHDVVFASYDGVVYALKEMAPHVVEREYALLIELGRRRLPAVEPIGEVRARTPAGEGEERGVLITRYLEASLPYRTLFMNRGLERYRERLLDAMTSLLVRLHLTGFYWGDCSLSNTLFRRDAGELQAFLVDAETSEFHDPLSTGLRRQDLMIMEENVTGELADLAVVVELPDALGVYDTGANIRERYERLWSEITREETIPAGESFRIHERIRALNGLGFSVGDVELIPSSEGDHLRVRAIVTDRDYHRHLMHSLTGVVAGERQAALLLNEISELQAMMSRSIDRSVPLSEAAYRWVDERFEPAVRKLGSLLGRAGDVSELYCQVLEHKWYLSERAQHDVGLDPAIDDYLQRFQTV